MPKSNGAGTIYRRGRIFWVQLYIDGKPINRSSNSDKKTDAVKLRDKLIAQRHRGEIAVGEPLINELLDDLLNSGKHKEPTLYIWGKVIDKNIRPFFGALRAARLSTNLMEQYRADRKKKCSDTTVNRELALLRMAYNLARKRTPPKVMTVPYFPMVTETGVRTGFLTDAEYAKVRDELPIELKALFVVAYMTGIRKGELLQIRWRQVDFEQRIITLERGETKNKEARTVPIVAGDMQKFLEAAKAACPEAEHLFNRDGKRIRNFRKSWAEACKRAGVPDLKFHDLRRTAVRNMRRAGDPQAVRMKISGHKTISMEIRYNITDMEDLNSARDLMEKRCSGSVAVLRNEATPGDTAQLEKSTR